MDWKVSRLTMEVRKYDRKLFAFRASNGMVQILREPDRLAASDYNQIMPDASSLNTQFILALTDNWTLQGAPADWGLEPVMQRLKEMDAWRDPLMTERMRKGREKEKEDQERMKRNEIRARAADMRSDFAKAVNDINTSTLEKVDRRRM